MCLKNLDYLRKWDGALKFVTNIKLKRYSKKKLLSPEPQSSGESTETVIPMEEAV